MTSNGGQPQLEQNYGLKNTRHSQLEQPYGLENTRHMIKKG